MIKKFWEIDVADTTAVVMAGGKSERLLGYDKINHSIDGVRPMIRMVCEDLLDRGFVANVLLAGGQNATLGQNLRGVARVKVSPNEELKGTAGDLFETVLKNVKGLRDYTLVVNGDTLLQKAVIDDLHSDFKDNKPQSVEAAIALTTKNSFGVQNSRAFALDAGRQVVRSNEAYQITTKPVEVAQEASSTGVIIYQTNALVRRALEWFQNGGFPKSTEKEFLPELIDEGKVWSVVGDYAMFDWGVPERLSFMQQNAGQLFNQMK